jgi:hypothetical protein
MARVCWLIVWGWTLGVGLLPLVGCAPMAVRLDTSSFHGAVVFASRTDFATGNNPWALALGDLNVDGKLDVVVVHQSASSGSVLLGNGDGTFGPKTDFATGDDPWALAVADLNADGQPDLVVANDRAAPSPSGWGGGTAPSVPSRISPPVAPPVLWRSRTSTATTNSMSPW